MILHSDYKEFIGLLNGTSVRYLVVDAHALAAYRYPRNTGDIDIFVAKDEVNLAAVINCLKQFGFADGTFTVEMLRESDVVQVGFSPVRIDLLTSISGVEFDDAWENRFDTRMDGTDVHVIGRAELILNRRATGRPRDLQDIAALERLE